ncbi:endo/excinuclease domain-containing protein [Caballeronia sordidicola]|uniref:Endo/excinuclease domain-containing protein n=2 Tax=Burkholderiaceae TaxID=119060 RepID=A0A158GJ73_CABSO|nr:endo/excinuclease domain-containing protein [Caballeronia sordidicola]
MAAAVRLVRRGTVILAEVAGFCRSGVCAGLRDNARHPVFIFCLMPWFLYLIECADGSLYTGIATDVDARFAKHLSGDGARYTRSRKPVAVRASFELSGRAEASRAEYWVKRLKVARKWALVAGELALSEVMPAEDIEDEGAQQVDT